MIGKPFNDNFKFATDLTIIVKKVMLVKSAPGLRAIFDRASSKMHADITADLKSYWL